MFWLSLLKGKADVKTCLQDPSGLLSTVYFESYLKAYGQTMLISGTECSKIIMYGAYLLE